MYVCVYICIYTYIHTHIFLYIYIYTHTYNNAQYVARSPVCQPHARPIRNLSIRYLTIICAANPVCQSATCQTWNPQPEHG